ncbi:Adenylate cyclase [hydrothermal vent metagenome]|uniref:Adenylate cyclase n=1 Tax=hydrothermal vent metagenome TaxID=652676 RepID=A0A3B0ZZA5_9ZZZZ
MPNKFKNSLSSVSSRTKDFFDKITAKVTPKHIPIAFKLSVVITLLISFGMVLLGSVIVSNQSQLVHDQINDFGKAIIEQLAESSKELVLSDDQLGLMVLVRNLNAIDSILGVVIYSDSGTILASTGILPYDDIISLYGKSDLLKNSSYTTDWILKSKDTSSQPVTSYIAPIRFQGIIAGHVVVNFSKNYLTKYLVHTIRAVVAATLLMIMLGIIASYYIGKRLSRPIDTFIKASQAIDSGDYNYRIKESRNDELGHLIGAFNTMANGLLEKNQVESIFSRFVSTNVAKQIMQNLDHVTLGGEHVTASVLFADIVGFTSMSEKLPAKEIAALLNEYFTYISIVSKLYHGTIDKYMGDCAMVVFGVPIKDEDHSFNAVSCAVMIQKLVDRLNALRIRNGQFPVYFRIGVNSGDMLAGNMGAQERMQYTVVGESVNLASRLLNTAENGQVIISQNMFNNEDLNWRLSASKCQEIKLRGISNPVTTYIVSDVAHTYRDKMDIQIEELLRDKIVA